MHFNFGFTAVQVLWTLTFAALLVLLVVLLGRDRARRFPWFTFSVALTALRLLASRMLFERMAPITTSAIFLTLAIVEALVVLVVLVELARRAFSGASRIAWIIGMLAMLAGGAAVLATWGPWPPWKTLTAESTLAVLRLMQLVAQKTDLLGDVLTIELGLVVVLFGRRFKAGWRSHTQQIVVGLSTAAIGQMAMRGIWQAIALHAVPHSQAEYEHVIGLQEKLYNANSVVFLAVLVWWIVCLWIDEPGTKIAATAEAEASAPGPDETPTD
ncbi:MAG TPA: hypothetical protein VGT08_18885 [Terracidiphilus sp.]|nr:hypothetical protein [Terracidiphilus sp.]